MNGRTIIPVLLIISGVFLFAAIFLGIRAGETSLGTLAVAIAWLMVYVNYTTDKMKRQILDELKEIKKQLDDCTTLRGNKQE